MPEAMHDRDRQPEHVGFDRGQDDVVLRVKADQRRNAHQRDHENCHRRGRKRIGAGQTGEIVQRHPATAVLHPGQITAKAPMFMKT